jgi:hypothetical protein
VVAVVFVGLGELVPLLAERPVQRHLVGLVGPGVVAVGGGEGAEELLLDGGERRGTAVGSEARRATV